MSENLNMPVDIDTEKSVVASALLDNNLIPEIFSRTDIDDFYDEKSRALYFIIEELYKSNISERIDTLVVYDFLKDHQEITSITISWVNRLTQEIVSTVNLNYHINRLKKFSKIRKVQNNLRKLMQDFKEPSEIASELQNIALAIYENKDTEMTHISTLTNEIIQEGKEVLEGKKIKKMYSGYDVLDDLTGGFKHGEMTVLAAQTSAGKSAFGLNLATNVAMQEYNVMCFVLEMSAKSVASRILHAASSVSLESLRSGSFSLEELEKLESGNNQISELPIWIYDKSVSINQIKMKIEQKNIELAKKNEKVDFVMVDYLHLLSEDEKSKSNYERVTKLSNKLRVLSNTVGAHFVVISQLNREVNGRPSLRHLRDSGAIEQDANNVIFLYREDYQDTTMGVDNDPSPVELILAKQRDGKTGLCHLNFWKKYQLFMPRGYDSSHNYETKEEWI